SSDVCSSDLYTSTLCLARSHLVAAGAIQPFCIHARCAPVLLALHPPDLAPRCGGRGPVQCASVRRRIASWWEGRRGGGGSDLAVAGVGGPGGVGGGGAIWDPGVCVVVDGDVAVQQA